MIFLFFTSFAMTQPDRWQQRVEYTMDINMDVKTHRYQGSQQLRYYNNSPDELNKVFYHLFFNAFQPGSMMDIRNQALPDSDSRVRGRIPKLEEDEIGFLKVKTLLHNGEAVEFEEVGTILEVQLNEPIPPGGTAKFDMTFDAQVPLQIRRSGRNSREGVVYSMTQWYPKLCEYDYQGWHANPYVGREFYGIWGDFDVTIHLDKAYMIGGTGYLQNPQEIGHGYEEKGKPLQVPEGDKLSWHFKAPNVHDFAWAADPDYTHSTIRVPDGPLVHFIYQPDEQTTKNWGQLEEKVVKAFQFINEHYGKYPYEQYTIIQGGDGGMEYAMATLITGKRSLMSLVGVSVHEIMHSWYQMVLGTNESLYAWMDEGFTSYASNVVMKYLFDPETNRDPHAGTYQGYTSFAKAGMEEPLSTHADHFNANRAYGLASYSKGAVFLHQLEYIIGKEAFDRGMLRYYDTWKFKHPNANDFIRVMEKESGLELDWYKEYWVNTTHTIDYGIQSVEREGKKSTRVTLDRVGKMPMPIEVEVTYTDNSKELFYAPLRIMRGEKPAEGDTPRTLLEDWPWTHPSCSFDIPVKIAKIKRLKIDPSGRMADVNKENDSFENR